MLGFVPQPNLRTAFLLADTELSFSDSNIVTIKSSIGHDGIKKGNSLYPRILHLSSGQISSGQVGSNQVATTEISVNQFGISQIGFIQTGMTQAGSTEIGIPEISAIKTALSQTSITEVRSTQINPLQVSLAQIGITHVNTNQVDFGQLATNQAHSSEISLPSSVTLQQLLSSNVPDHYLSSFLINTFKDNLPYITLEITDLPTGQLAEAQVTEYTNQGIPNGGKILIDHNANGLGWFIDPTPFDHSEFSQTITDTALLATADSEAHGKYDLLTTILHEMSHLAGFISGYTEFDRRIQTINGKKTFIGDNFTATLTPDGSHLDPIVHPYDLMNTSLKPGVRKLPSLLNLQILNTLRSEGVREGVSEGILTAPLTSAPLFGINNGTFDTQDTWSTRGAANIIEGQAVLTEESRLNSNFTQDFIIPDEAKYLQFTILDADLDNSNLAPGDAFEVALLDTNTFTPLAGITNEFTQTDALLNIQHDGDTYFSDKVKLSGAPTSGSSINLNSDRTVTVDIRDIAPNTEATLYFDLLGFGSKQSKVVIDNVRILTDDVIIPVANNNTATTNQGQPVIIDILDNDTDADGTINPSTVQIETAPTNGNITINDDNTITYTPNSNQPGEDSSSRLG